MTILTIISPVFISGTTVKVGMIHQTLVRAASFSRKVAHVDLFANAMAGLTFPQSGQKVNDVEQPSRSPYIYKDVYIYITIYIYNNVFSHIIPIKLR